MVFSLDSVNGINGIQGERFKHCTERPLNITRRGCLTVKCLKVSPQGVVGVAKSFVETKMR